MKIQISTRNGKGTHFVITDTCGDLPRAVPGRESVPQTVAAAHGFSQGAHKGQSVEEALPGGRSLTFHTNYQRTEAPYGRNKWGHRLCVHGRQHRHCRTCGGSGVCRHGRRRDRCTTHDCSQGFAIGKAQREAATYDPSITPVHSTNSDCGFRGDRRTDGVQHKAHNVDGEFTLEPWQ